MYQRWRGSDSSVWGSARSQSRSASARIRRYSAMSSLSSGSETPDSDVSLDLTTQSGQSAQLSGSRGVVCKTHAEYKANKLNRNEQTKMQNELFRVNKEKELSEKRFSQSEKALRTKSASLKSRMRNIESASFTEAERPSSFFYERTTRRPGVDRPLSYPGTSLPAKNHQERCHVCEQIQKIIFMYEHGSDEGYEPDDTSNHTMCVFSDVQVQTFMQMLEEKYLSDVPAVNNQSKESIAGITRSLDKDASGKKPRDDITNTIARRKVEVRIQKFCKELDKINKEERAIPEEVKEEVERKRMENAICRLQKAPPRHEQIIAEVKQLLKL